MSIAYLIAPRGGGITEHPIPAGGIDIGDGVVLRASAEDMPEDCHWRAWTLDRVAEIVGRCAPWCVTWCAPAILHDGEDWGGRCLAGCQILAISTSASASHGVSLAYHECGHACDGYLLPGPQAVLDAATSIMDWPGEYLASPEERRARLIQHVCMVLDHGAALHILPGSATETAWQIYTGDMARQRDAALAAAEAARVAAARPSLFRRAKELVHV